MPVAGGADIAPVVERKLVLRGLLLNLSKPKAVLAGMSILALGVGSTDDSSGPVRVWY